MYHMNRGSLRGTFKLPSETSQARLPSSALGFLLSLSLKYLPREQFIKLMALKDSFRYKCFCNLPQNGIVRHHWNNQLLTGTNFCSSLCFTSVKYTMIKTYMEGRFCLTYKIQSIIKGSQV